MPILKYLQLPFYFNAGLLREEVNHLAGNLWQQHYQKLHYDGEWSALPFRSIDGKADDVYISPGDDNYQDTALLQACPYFKEVLSTFQCPLQAVRLLKLAAGGVIKEHRDADLCFEKGEIRIHIPVVTNELVEFYLDKERIDLKAGECWYMNFNLPHAISNNSQQDRIHLVIDAIVNDWVKDLFAQPSLNKKETADKGLDDETKKMIILQLRSQDTETSNRLADEMEMSIHKKD